MQGADQLGLGHVHVLRLGQQALEVGDLLDAGLGVSVEDDLNPKSTADAPICYSFLNAGRCYRKFCSFRHLVPEHPEARADAARRGMAIGPRVEAAVT